MIPKPRVIDTIDYLRSGRTQNLLDIFSKVSYRNRSINIKELSIGGSIIYGIVDGATTGQNFRSWRFQTTADGIVAHYHEIWTTLGKDKYFLDRSYFHLYTLDEENSLEKEYVLLHCDASEPDDSPHCSYKQSPHLHIEVAAHPIPKAHFALYNGRTIEVLKNTSSFNQALAESVEMLDSQVLKLHE